MSGWMEKAEALEDIYNDLDLLGLRSDVIDAVGEDQAEEIVCEIDGLYCEMRHTIWRLLYLADAEDARAADGAEGR